MKTKPVDVSKLRVGDVIYIMYMTESIVEVNIVFVYDKFAVAVLPKSVYKNSPIIIDEFTFETTKEHYEMYKEYRKLMKEIEELREKAGELKRKLYGTT